jgi:hypothetical protein
MLIETKHLQERTFVFTYKFSKWKTLVFKVKAKSEIAAYKKARKMYQDRFEEYDEMLQTRSESLTITIE